MPRAHAEQIANTHGASLVIDVSRELVGEVRQHLVIEREESVISRHADGGRGEALAQRIEHMGIAFAIRRPPALGHQLPLANDHHAMQRIHLIFGGGHKVEYCLGREPGRLGACGFPGLGK
ncbi:MAG: hypothetical protein ACI8W8_002836 [Rhodothermales bacterium]|jgi:hypothetical protein